MNPGGFMDFSTFGILAAGFLTFLSPCVLPLAPIYLGILAGGVQSSPDADVAANRAARFRIVLSTVVFVAGFTLVFSVLGLSATFIGRLMVAHRELFAQLGGLLIVLMGLHFLGWLKLPFMERSTSGMSRKRTGFHYLNAFLTGVAFAFVWSPCIGAVLGSVLTYTSLKTTSPVEGMGLLALYGVGFGVPLVAFAALGGWIMPLFGRAKRFLPVFTRVTGGLLVVVGLLLNTGYMQRLDVLMEGGAAPSGMTATADETTRDLGNMIAGTSTAPVGVTCDSTAAPGSVCAAVETRPVMLEFFSPGCHICRQMIPVVDAVRAECSDDKVLVRMVDVTTDAGRGLAARYGVTGIPVFVFETPDGREKARLVGRQTFETMQQTLSALTGRSCSGYREVGFLRD